MAYLDKTQVEQYLQSCVKEINTLIESKGPHAARQLMDPNVALQNLHEEKDAVGFFYLTLNDENGNDNLNMAMHGKTFIRIDGDLYCDDRYIVDLYQSVLENRPVTEVIRERIGSQGGEAEQQEAL
jgi:hypothetical protein